MYKIQNMGPFWQSAHGIRQDILSSGLEPCHFQATFDAEGQLNLVTQMALAVYIFI